MTTLILGECSFIGEALASGLTGTGSRVVLYGRERVFNDDPLVDVVVGEVSSEYSLKTVVSKYVPETIFFAPPKMTDTYGAYSEIEDIKHFSSCVSAIFSVLYTYVPKRFALISTADVYGSRGGAKKKLLSEKTVKNPQTARAVLYSYAEELLIQACERIGCEHYIFRLGELFGGNVKYPHSKMNFVAQTLAKGQRVGISDASSYKDFNDVGFSVRSMLECMDVGLAGVTNIGSGHSWTVRQMVTMLSKAMGSPKGSVIFRPGGFSHCLDLYKISGLISGYSKIDVCCQIDQLASCFEESE